MYHGWTAQLRADRLLERLSTDDARSQDALRGRPLLNAPDLVRFRRGLRALGLGLALVVGCAFAPAAADSLPAAETDAAAQTASIAPPSLEQSESTAEEAEAKPAVPDPDEILEFGAMRVKRWIVETVLRAAEETDVDPVYMMALADKESSFITANRASTSSAEGLFQFIASTWLEMVRSFGAKHGLDEEAEAITLAKGKLVIADEDMREHVLGLRRDPYLSALMAGEMMKRDRVRIERRIGRSISRSEFYLAHFLGADSAGKMMALVDDKPGHSAPKAFPAAAKANKSLFYAKKGRKTRNLSVAEVYEKIDGMIDARIDRYRNVEAMLADTKLADVGP